MENYFFGGEGGGAKFVFRLDVIFYTLRFGFTKQSNYNMVFIVELSW